MLNKIGRVCTSFLIISIVLGVTIQNPDFPVSKIISNFDLNKPSLDDFEGAIPLIDSFESPYIPQSAASQPTPPPRTGYQLKALVESLINATPIESRDNDTDGDGLPNSVEIVIGTDWNNPDSDYDRLSDYDEIWTDLDPLEPDSNKDGHPDYHEVTDVISLDIDSDGFSNAWDFDNDGDNVNDAIDLSPQARSEPNDSFHFDITTNGNPSYFTFQLRPENPEHMLLIGQTWDWPAPDYEGVMQDWEFWVNGQYESSKEDVQVLPYLKLTADTITDQLQSQVDMYGIQITNNTMFVPLFPIWEHGTIVALSGKAFYPESSSNTLSMDAQMIWQVIGTTDRNAFTLQTHSYSDYMSITEDGSVEITSYSSEINASELFYKIALSRGKYQDTSLALKSVSTGRYLAVNDDGSLSATSSELNDRAIFVPEYDHPNTNVIRRLQAYNGEYLAVNRDGTQIVTVDYQQLMMGWSAFYLSSGKHQPENIVLVTYPETFMLTGFNAEENYGTNAAIFYSADTNQTMGANLGLAFSFLRNATTHVTDMPTLLKTNHNVTISNQVITTTHTDAAIWALVEELNPSALMSLPAGQNIPLITAVEDQSTNIDLVQLGGSFPVLGHTWEVNLAAAPKITSKTLKTDWYNTTSFEVLTIDKILTEIHSWGLEETAAVNIMQLMFAWNTGEQSITQIGEVQTEFQSWSYAWLGEISLFITVVDDLHELFSVLASPKHGTYVWFLSLKLQNMLVGTRVANWGNKALNILKTKCTILVKGFTQLGTALSKLSKIIDALDVIGAVVGIGIAFYALVSIGQSTQWSHQGTNLAILYFLWQATLTIALTLIGMIPGAWILVLAYVILDYFFGISDTFLEYIWEQMYHYYPMTEVDFEPKRDVELVFDDVDGNGPDVGDRIEYTFGIIGNISATADGDGDAVMTSKISPTAHIMTPSGAISDSGSLPTEVIYPDPWGENYMWHAQEFETTVWFQPSVGMPNFPFLVWLSIYYETVYMEEEFSLFDFQWHEYRHNLNDTITTDPYWIYFDVLPGTIADFTNWRGITSYDHDHDGLPDSEETRTHPWRWDTDADGLSDKYELDMGTDPTEYDTDMDGLLDWFELVYGTDATQRDTDFDGLTDYLELSGWMIEFSYHGQDFTMPVHSDPLLPDTEEDGLDDQLEYLSNLNPRSYDTNSDGIVDLDVAEPSIIIHSFPFEKDIRDPLNPFVAQSVAVDPTDNTLWVADTGYNRLMKLYPNSTLIDEWGGPAVNPDQFRGPNAVAVDPNDGSIYVADSGSEIASNPPNVTATGVQTNGEFGASMAINPAGNTLVVGADIALFESGSVGSAYIFTRTETGWTQEVKLTPSDGGYADKFGRSVAINSAGNVVVIGSPDHSYGGGWSSSNPWKDRGAAYVYLQTVSGWTQVKISQTDSPDKNVFFGSSVAISGDGTIVGVGAIGKNAAYIYRRSGATLTFLQKIYISSWEYFGSSMAISEDGNIIAVGAREYADEQGAVYVYQGSGGRWTLQQKLTASDGTSDSDFGYRIALNPTGNTLVVGAYDANAAYIFTRAKTIWTQQQKLSNPTGNHYAGFGGSIALNADGNIVVVGNYNNHEVYVYKRTEGIWNRRAILTYPERIAPVGSLGRSPDCFGTSVAINAIGDTIIVGDTSIDSSMGAFFTFEASEADHLQKYSSNGTLLGSWSLGFGNKIAWDIVVGSNGDVYVTYYDGKVRNVLQYDSSGTLIRTFGADRLSRPWGIAMDPNDDFIYVADYSANRILKFDTMGNFINSLDSTLYHPTGVAVDDYGYIYVTRNDYRVPIQMFDPREQTFITGKEYLFWSLDIAVDAEGDLYIITNSRLKKYTHHMEYESLDISDPEADNDGDGLPNKDEIAGWMVTFTNSTTSSTLHVTSNPLLKDTDYDGLSDDLEAIEKTNPRDPDTDDDGKSDYAEWRGFSPKTNPNHYDTDGDGLEDTTELTFGSAPTISDTEDDGLNDLEEFALNSNPVSNDTDGDGLNDQEEVNFNSSLLHPDSDGDFMFDNMEKILNTNPWSPDSDGDGLSDGFEILYGTEPLFLDSDGDHIPDGEEVDLRMNPLNPDTDYDGIPDGDELLQGTNPRNSDTDGDGISDNKDPDSIQQVVDHIILAYDPSPEGDQFAESLAQYTNITVVSPEELINYTEEPYIVLVGRLDVNDTIGTQIHEILADTEDILHLMQESDANRMAVRHGYWTPTQTLVLLSQPYPSDHLHVLNLFSRQTVTVQPDVIHVEFHGNLMMEYGGESAVIFNVDEIDTVQETDAILLTILEEEIHPQVELHRYNSSTISQALTLASGLESSEEAVNRYLTINLSEINQVETSVSFEGALLQLYYTGTDLDRTGDGEGHTPGDLDENTLAMYNLNEASGEWSKLSVDGVWVNAMGVNTTDVEMYGKQYEGYVWAVMSHFSTFGLASTRIVDVTSPTLSAPGDSMYEVGTTGHNISWIAGDRYPGTYELRNGTVLIDSGNWTNGTLIGKVDGLPLGNYNFSLVIWDLANHSATDIVGLTVFNTPIGTNIVIMDPNTAVNVTFSEVINVGTTYISLSEEEPGAPTLFKVIGPYYDITTTATYSGTIIISLPYNETQVSGSESYLHLHHWDPETEEWTRITTDIDSTNNLIIGEASSLSVFTVTEYIIPIGLLWWVIPPVFLLSVLLIWRWRRKRSKD